MVVKAVSNLIENMLIRPINYNKSTHIFFFHLQRDVFKIYSNGYFIWKYNYRKVT